ncbi:MAG: hypothetical protein QGF00_28275 [Planctomycetota bacterium]|jgi:hypothetical protein|nr:hypothetical protein [Planctomycetota bacterium]|tara:strand:- start:356 stop:577 length:222 start_codon:yes stop_codon:yes gene_type:complete
MASSENQQDQALKLTSLSLENAALLLSKSSGKQVTLETLKADVEAGCPLNSDGTFNVMYYASWLVREVANRGD